MGGNITGPAARYREAGFFLRNNKKRLPGIAGLVLTTHLLFYNLNINVTLE